MRIGSIHIALAAALGAAAGCIGGGGPTGENELPIVGIEEAIDLYSENGCAELQAVDLDIVYVAVRGHEGLVALVSDGVPVCVATKGMLRMVGSPTPPFGQAFDLPSELPTSATCADPGGDGDPHPEPADGERPSIAEDPHPEPAGPASPLPPPGQV